MTKEALARTHEAFRQEWGAMGPEAREADARLYADRHRAKDLREDGDPTTMVHASGPERASHWRMGSTQATVAPTLVRAALQSGWRMPSWQEVQDPKEYVIESPVEPLLGASVLESLSVAHCEGAASVESISTSR